MQDDIRKVVKAWVEKANEANINRMRQNAIVKASSSQMKDPTTGEGLV